jgi:hypothetical protein
LDDDKSGNEKWFNSFDSLGASEHRKRGHRGFTKGSREHQQAGFRAQVIRSLPASVDL